MSQRGYQCSYALEHVVNIAIANLELLARARLMPQNSKMRISTNANSMQGIHWTEFSDD